MKQIFGFDIGTTSIGWAVIEHDAAAEKGSIKGMGVRIFPEARDPDGTPLNQQRRLKRMMRRQLRRRRQRRRDLNEQLLATGLLPPFDTPEWHELMQTDPYELRRRGISGALTPHELGRAIYHLSKRRHFRGREQSEEDQQPEQSEEDRQAQTGRDHVRRTLQQRDLTLGALLAERAPGERKRGEHAHREVVEAEFDQLWRQQVTHHPSLLTQALQEQLKQAIFDQRPVFWRKNTLGRCPLMPGQPLCPRGSWLSQQRRMLEKLNNLKVVHPNGTEKPLDDEERQAILGILQTRRSLTWTAIRKKALKPLWEARGQQGERERVTFNLERGGARQLLGNPLEAQLAEVFGTAWAHHPHKDGIREMVPRSLWSADYREIGDQRVAILRGEERRQRRQQAARDFVAAFSISDEEARKLAELSLPSGWEPYSTAAIKACMPHLEAGVPFGSLLASPDWEEWRGQTFPGGQPPTTEGTDRLPSPASREERERLAELRNPTVVRVQNELRKVVNNLLSVYGKPECIRIELAREVGLSKRQREEMAKGMRDHEKRREAAKKDLAEKGITNPSRDQVDKWLLWKEADERCPYTGDHISFANLFGENPQFDIEHIWPRSRSFDNSFRNKTLCRRDENVRKGNRTPYEYLGHQEERWHDVCHRLDAMGRGRNSMSRGKVRRFLATSIPDDFANRQLADTGYASRQAIRALQRLWGTEGPEGTKQRVQAVSGRVTAQLRRLWILNNILGDTGEKTRADHRHHAIDALTVACTNPGLTQRLTNYWQERDDPRTPRPTLAPPWPAIRADAEKAVAAIFVSHRVQKKVSGALHKETIYGNTLQDFQTNSGIYRQYVTRKPVESLTKTMLNSDPAIHGEGIRDRGIRRVLQAWVNEHGGPKADPKRAFPPYPTLGEQGPEIRKVRLLIKQQEQLMVPLRKGSADLGNNHHIAFYQSESGTTTWNVVSLFEAAYRLSRRQPVVSKKNEAGDTLLMSLALRDTVHLPEESRYGGYWVVISIWSAGQLVLKRPSSASQERIQPTAKRLIRYGMKKVSVDPIGRIRPAND